MLTLYTLQLFYLSYYFLCELLSLQKSGLTSHSSRADVITYGALHVILYKTGDRKTLKWN